MSKKLKVLLIVLGLIVILTAGVLIYLQQTGRLSSSASGTTLTPMECRSGNITIRNIVVRKQPSGNLYNGATVWGIADHCNGGNAVDDPASRGSCVTGSYQQPVGQCQLGVPIKDGKDNITIRLWHKATTKPGFGWGGELDIPGLSEGIRYPYYEKTKIYLDVKCYDFRTSSDSKPFGDEVDPSKC